ncbi:MAG: hypothetical protein ABJV04_14925 [Aliiglaciecola sp.]|uniref:hypothetical protein n=1 Tax=Aliiglaciecola sp. TaxID=1872441 RepID=UPI003297F127
MPKEKSPQRAKARPTGILAWFYICSMGFSPWGKVCFQRAKARPTVIFQRDRFGFRYVAWASAHGLRCVSNGLKPVLQISNFV